MHDDPGSPPMPFSEEYGRMRTLQMAVREETAAFDENLVQYVWQDQLFSGDNLETADGRKLEIISPGWWNRSEGPDFQNAQIRFNGSLRTGDVEIHLHHGAWRQHGHHQDPRYDEVMLEVVLASTPPPELPRTSAGKPIPVLLLSNYLEQDLTELAMQADIAEYPFDGAFNFGRCGAFVEKYGAEDVGRLAELAGDWRLLMKSQAMSSRIERAGVDQTLYEAFLTACGYSRYKTHFRLIARNLPYDRVRQLALRNPMLVEAAFLQLAGLLPETLPDDAEPNAHFERLQKLRRDELSGLRALPLTWNRGGTRPNNYPERRLAGAARVLARTSREGFSAAVSEVWTKNLTPAARRKAFEALFPSALGFWAEHCTWTGKRMKRPVAPLGPARIRAIVGNVFVPIELALARRLRNRDLEEKVFQFFAKLPKESDNHIVDRMIPRIFRDEPPKRLTFRVQQGMIQLYQDWCEPNPSCSNCPVVPFLDQGAKNTP